MGSAHLHLNKNSQYHQILMIHSQLNHEVEMQLKMEGAFHERAGILNMVLFVMVRLKGSMIFGQPLQLGSYMNFDWCMINLGHYKWKWFPDLRWVCCYENLWLQIVAMNWDYYICCRDLVHLQLDLRQCQHMDDSKPGY